MVRGSRVTVIRGYFSTRLKASSVQGSKLKTQDFLQFCSSRLEVIQGLFQYRAAGCSAVYVYLIV